MTEPTATTVPFRLTGRHFRQLGLRHGPARGLAVSVAETWSSDGLDEAAILDRLSAVCDKPEAHVGHPVAHRLAETLVAQQALVFDERETPAPYVQWGSDLEPESIAQMQNACRLPVATRGALMPDAHRGYGLPIGGVLATRGAVIPYAVGVDIACRMKLTVLDMPPSALVEPLARFSPRLVKMARAGERPED